ncbi:MAG: hypothetical protein ACI38U_02205 [Corynebacterium sp.]|uniref:hypothetical protein n=1 Tax=Corynebacterium sp. TaxID=1720 RepID=UPI003EFF3E73
MPSYNLYESLGLDRSKSPVDLGAELDQRLAGVARDTPEFYELDAARSVLGDSVKRQMYDQRLASDAEVTVTDIQHLAAMSVRGWDTAAGATSAGAGAGVGAKVSGAARATGAGVKSAATASTNAVRWSYGHYPKATIAAGVVGVAAIVALAGATTSVVGGGDDAATTAANSTSGSDSGEGKSDAEILEEHMPEESETLERAQETFDSYNFAEPGDSINMYDFEEYVSTDDGETKRRWSNDPEATMTLSNMREVSHTVRGDSTQPDDHPLAADQEYNFACFDVEERWKSSASGSSSLSRPQLVRVNSGGFLEIGKPASDQYTMDPERRQHPTDADVFSELEDEGFEEGGRTDDVRDLGEYHEVSYVDCWRTDITDDLKDFETSSVFGDSDSAGGYVLSVARVETMGNSVNYIDEPDDNIRDGQQGWYFEKDQDDD